jgi:hypothetical protein
LEDSGFIQKKRIWKKGSGANTVTVLQLLRPPNDDDIKGLSYRRKVRPDTFNSILEEDDDGDDIMRDIDLELDFPEQAEEDTDNDRIPPQWTPDRLIPNLAFDAINCAGTDGYDNAQLRDKTMGKFWKRPTESYMTRLTDNWELSQPHHLRHLALVRDTAVTEERRFVHYVFRTYGNFQKAVDEGQVSWEAVSKEAQKLAASKKPGRPQKPQQETILNQWGFTDLDVNDFHRRIGSSTLAECRTSVYKARQRNYKWGKSIVQDVSHEKLSRRPIPKPKGTKPATIPAFTQVRRERNIAANVEPPQTNTMQPAKIADVPREVSGVSRGLDASLWPLPKPAQKPQLAIPLLTAEQRKALGLPPRGRLGIAIETQISEHRRKTGDPNALPDILFKEDEQSELRVKPKRKKPETAMPSLFTVKFRKAHGLPLKGRLSQTVIDHFRAQQNDASGVASEEQQSAPELIEDGIASQAETSETASVPDLIPFIKDRSKDRLELHTPSIRKVAEKAPPERSIKTPRPNVTFSPTQQCDDSVRSIIASPDNQETIAAKVIGAANSADLSQSRADLRASAPLNADLTIRNDVAEVQPRVETVQAGHEWEQEQRQKPGAYFYKNAKRRAPRGRPKKACMMVFRNSKLKDLEWFRPGAETSNQKAGSKTRKQSLKRSSVLSQDESRLPMTPSMANNVPSPALSPTLITTPEPCEDPEQDDTFPAQGPTPVEEESEVSSSRSPFQIPVSEPQRGCKVLGSTTPSAGPLETESPSNSATIILPDSSLFPVELFRESNSSAPIIESPVNHVIEDGVVVSTEETSKQDIPSPSNAQANEDLNDTPEADHSQVSVSDDVGASSGIASDQQQSGKVLPTRGVRKGQGSVYLKRTRIIEEIMTMCDGVFPHNGEMLQPFCAVWEQRVGPKSGRPDRATVAKTINSMIADPNGAIHKIVFSFPTRDGTRIDRAIIASKNISINDPRVQNLQKSIINVGGKKFYPEAVAHLDAPEPNWRKRTVPAIDDSISIEALYPERANKVHRRRRRNEFGELESAEALTRKGVGRKPGPKPRLVFKSVAAKTSRGRVRLDALIKSYNMRRISNITSDNSHEDDDNASEAESERETSPTSSGTSEDTPLMQIRSTDSGVMTGRQDNDDVESSEDEDEDESSANVSNVVDDTVGDDDQVAQSLLTYAIDQATLHNEQTLEVLGFGVMDLSSSCDQTSTPTTFSKGVRFYPNIGIFSTDYAVPSTAATFIKKGEQTAYRFVLEDGKSQKRKSVTTRDVGTKRVGKRQIREPDEASEAHSRKLSKKHRKSKDMSAVGAKQGSQKFPQVEPPTTLERLSGLTGNPAHRLPVPPRKKKHRDRPVDPFKSPIKRRHRNHVERPERPGVFTEILCTLVIASSLSGEDGVVDWNIVSKACGSDKGYDLHKIKQVWSWVQQHMDTHFRTLTANFQSTFLEAYENGAVDSIDDPETYDWAALVAWTLKNCKFSEPPLPLETDNLREHVVEEPNGDALNRVNFYTYNIAHVNRAQRVLDYAYGAPLHETCPINEDEETLRARSWIRSNTATPQTVYDGTHAHNKLSKLNDSTLERVVLELVDEGMIKMRKLKRLLPGRNYNFVPKFATNYRRTYELDIFMDAVAFKKAMDKTFASPDPDLRTVKVSRTAKDGSAMALMSLVNDGQVKLVPKLPPVNNELKAPLPRLSVWGFSEGDYVFRKIDRERVFWELHAEPTSSYQFGNPLQPSATKSLSQAFTPINQNTDPVNWTPLLEPPLPGKHNDDALLPIWSSIDGQHVTWPWWNRMLNLVLQPLIFQPGASVAEIHRHCSNRSAELFEVQLILDWLVSINAAYVTPEKTYTAKAVFWAVFGDKLRGSSDIEDWFGQHVRKAKTLEARQPWRAQVNMTPRVAAILQGVTVDTLEDEILYVRDDLSEDELGDDNDVIFQPQRKKRKRRTGGDDGSRLSKRSKTRQDEESTPLAEPSPETAESAVGEQTLSENIYDSGVGHGRKPKHVRFADESRDQTGQAQMSAMSASNDTSGCLDDDLDAEEEPESEGLQPDYASDSSIAPASKGLQVVEHGVDAEGEPDFDSPQPDFALAAGDANPANTPASAATPVQSLKRKREVEREQDQEWTGRSNGAKKAKLVGKGHEMKGRVPTSQEHAGTPRISMSDLVKTIDTDAEEEADEGEDEDAPGEPDPDMVVYGDMERA